MPEPGSILQISCVYNDALDPPRFQCSTVLHDDTNNVILTASYDFEESDDAETAIQDAAAAVGLSV